MSVEIKQHVIQLGCAPKGRKRILRQQWEGDFSTKPEADVFYVDELSPENRAIFEANEKMINSLTIPTPNPELQVKPKE